MTVATKPLTLIIDKTHSEAVFQVRHLVTKVRGRFTDFEGTIEVDEVTPAQSSVTFTIRTASVNTNVADRDAHLRSEDFFHVEKYPTITFASTNVERTGERTYAVTGDLTIRGVTKPLTLAVTSLGTATDPWGNLKAGFEADATLNRRDFGLMWNAALETGGFLVGDEVSVSLSLQATVQA